MCTYLQRMLSTLTRKLMQKPPVHKRQQQRFFFMRRKIKSKSIQVFILTNAMPKTFCMLAKYIIN